MLASRPEEAGSGRRPGATSGRPRESGYGLAAGAISVLGRVMLTTPFAPAEAPLPGPASHRAAGLSPLQDAAVRGDHPDAESTVAVGRSWTDDEVAAWRSEFPILATTVGRHPLIYFDNAASSQRPQAVIDRLSRYASAEHANIHRGVHHLSQLATTAYEESRQTVARWLGVADSRQVIFTRGTTEAINLVAATWGRQHVQAGDEILLTQMEHHANIVPWQLLAEAVGAKVVVAPVTPEGAVDLAAWEALLSPRTRLVGLVHTSNTLGTVNPVGAMVAAARAHGAVVLVDGAQAVPHGRPDLPNFDPDFFVFSGHKVGGPTGIGILYGRAELLEAMPPYQGGGDMIERVSFSGTTYRGIPERFEAGTPNIEGAIALATALDFMDRLGTPAIRQREGELGAYFAARLAEIPGLHRYGTTEPRVPIFSFNLAGAHPSDVGTMLDLDGIAVRTGHHCCMPLWEHYGVPGTVRASLAFYNTTAEIDTFMASLDRIRRRLT